MLLNLPSIKLPKLKRYNGMLELLDPEYSKDLRFWQPSGGLWSMNRFGTSMTILNSNIHHYVLRKFPKIRVMLTDGMTTKNGECRYGTMSSCRDFRINSREVYLETLHG